MKIGIMSDSHDNNQNIRKAVELFKERNIDLLIHCGDYISPGTAKLFDGLKLIGIFGNCDGAKVKLVEKFSKFNGEIKGDFCELDLDDLKFAIYHGTNQPIKEALVKCGKYDVVCSGHEHKVENKKVGKTLSLNPGTTHGFEDKATIMLFDTKTKEVEVIELK